MAKRKIYPSTQNHQISDKDDIKTAEVGDYCYFLDGASRISWGVIEKIINERGILGFNIICQVEFRHYTIPSEYCSFNKKYLKGKKRHQFGVSFA
jgi:uncharacterized protein YkvS